MFIYADVHSNDTIIISINWYGTVRLCLYFIYLSSLSLMLMVSSSLFIRFSVLHQNVIYVFVVVMIYVYAPMNATYCCIFVGFSKLYCVMIEWILWIYGCGIIIQIVDVDYWCISNNTVMMQLPLLFFILRF